MSIVEQEIALMQGQNELALQCLSRQLEQLQSSSARAKQQIERQYHEKMRSLYVQKIDAMKSVKEQQEAVQS